MLYRLREAGYEAFLVGGCVRDLLLGITPKDFDIATSALPEEVNITDGITFFDEFEERKFSFR